jgi:hypothetical protein
MLIKEIKGDYNNCVGFPGQVSLTNLTSCPFPVVADPLPHLISPSSAGWQSSLRRELCARWIELVEKLYKSANRHYKSSLALDCQVQGDKPLPPAKGSPKRDQSPVVRSEKAAVSSIEVFELLSTLHCSHLDSLHGVEARRTPLTLLFLVPHARLLDQHHVQDSPRVVSFLTSSACLQHLLNCSPPSL